jgi:scyllo-inositol 2-dehydrogenase (NADP+)
MRVVVAGLGIQGRKRSAIAGENVVATVDPLVDVADFKSVHDVPLDSYDAVLLCIPDGPKVDLLDYLISNGKHALVEKPVISASVNQLAALAEKARTAGTACYTAYNHRFEPHFVRMKSLIESGELGRIYSMRMFYGNGTARDVRNSQWRDTGAGVLPDLGSHLIDTTLFFFGDTNRTFHPISFNRYENKAFDHFVIGSPGIPDIELEVTLLSWRNHFTCDVFAENGSAHIESLCKWGPSTFTHRTRVLPSGRPAEGAVTLVHPDPTWALEYAYFKDLCDTGGTNLYNDVLINTALGSIAAATDLKAGAWLI